MVKETEAEKLDRELREFFDLFIISLNLVENEYYKTTYQNIENFYEAVQNYGKIDGTVFHRYGERVFCYELYHQLRMQLDRLENPLFLNGSKLQCEVNKFQILDLFNKFGVNPLMTEYIPDFLMHTPGNYDYHAFIIEVKSTPTLTPSSFLKDLAKIDEFLRFGYAKGIFLTVNRDAGHIERLIRENVEAIQSLTRRDDIIVISKEEKEKDYTAVELKNV